MARMCAGVVPKQPPRTAYSSSGSFAREKREIFRRKILDRRCGRLRAWGNRVGHAADAKLVNRSKFTKDWKQSLRAERAICADDLDVLIFEFARRRQGAKVAVRDAFLSVSKLRDDRQQREGPNGADGEKNFFNVSEGF